MTDLGTLGGRSSYAWGVNNAGQVTGYSDITGSGSGSDRTYHAFLYAGGHDDRPGYARGEHELRLRHQ